MKIPSITKHRRFARLVVAAVVACCMLAVASVGPTLAAGGQTGSVRGTVLDPTGKPVAGAVVTMTSPSGRYHATTDGNGTFRVIGATVDAYTVSVAKDGYDTFTTSGVEVPGDQIFDLGPLTLQPAAH